MPVLDRWQRPAPKRIAARWRISKAFGLPVVSLSPEEAGKHFGWFAMFAGLDLAASSAWTREQLGWEPTGPDLITDLRRMDYSLSAAAA